ncbi:MAG: hypothetical protein NZ902_03815 [Acidilobaceae archaeon]|nr:hypothetical protein [Acidilobaceae archaeon]MCX8165144.1 hypothetical protein [Acidilobaceae archaeon]MDW7974340.1 hypothetical protein [Sulfolobales archaeon]
MEPSTVTLATTFSPRSWAALASSSQLSPSESSSERRENLSSLALLKISRAASRSLGLTERSA